MKPDKTSLAIADAVKEYLKTLGGVMCLPEDVEEHISRVALANAVTPTLSALCEGWIPVQKCPESWEGKILLWFNGYGISIQKLPKKFSREMHHCEGVFVQQLPAPPKET